MARGGCTGFDLSVGSMTSSPDGGVWVGSGLSIDNSVKRTGRASLKISLVSGVEGYLNGMGSVSGVAFFRFYVMVTARPATTARGIFGITSVSSLVLRLNPDGTLAVYDNTTLLGTSSVALTDTDKWYRIEVRNGTGSSTALLRVDGVDQVTASTSTPWWPSRLGAWDTTADTYTVYFDDWTTDDTTWCDEGAVALLLPISDSQVGSWTGGAGGTTNLYDAVNNTPPVGTATETNTTQIESNDASGNNSTDEYRATLTSYASAGIGPNDTIHAIRAFIVHGEDVSTSTKTGSYGFVSNPTSAAYSAFTFGGDSGALGTHPTGWQTAIRTETSPVVDIAASPVFAVRKTDLGTRVGSVELIGAYVDYTPGPPPRRDPYLQLLAH